jgi:nucleotide-binding universal stress UspA family protein
MYSQILVPLDGSEASERAVSHGQSLAQSFSATVHLLNVITRPEELGVTYAGDNLELLEHARDLAEEVQKARLAQSEQYLAQVASPLRDAGLSVETAVLEGGAPENIAQYAREKNIDLIVMSTRGRGGVGRLLLGSVTDRVIRSIRLPVLAVPPE